MPVSNQTRILTERGCAKNQRGGRGERKEVGGKNGLGVKILRLEGDRRVPEMRRTP